MLASVFIIFQPVLTPAVHAVSSWEGNPWEGNPWEGESWDGRHLEWEGTDWEGNSWERDSWSPDGDWEGKPWERDSWSPDGDWEGNSWERDSWSRDGFIGANPWERADFSRDNFTGSPWIGNDFTSGNPWTGTDFSGDNFTGNPWTGNNSTDGNPWTGNGFSNDSFSGDPYNRDPGSGENSLVGPIIGQSLQDLESGTGKLKKAERSSYETPDRFYDSTNYKATEHLIKDMTVGTINEMDNVLTDPDYTNMDAGEFMLDLVVNNAKLHVDNDLVFDTYDAGKGARDTYKHVKDLNKIRQNYSGVDTATQTGKTINTVSNASKTPSYGRMILDSGKEVLKNTDIKNIPNTLGQMSAVSKLNGVTSMVSAGFSAYQTGASAKDAYNVWTSDSTGAEKTSATADVGSNFGELMMDVGMVTSVIPGGQAAGVTMMAVGAGLYGVSKATKVIADNWDTVKALPGKALNGAKKAGKAAKDWVTGLFS